ncbi:MAG: hypothetical protein HXX08_17645 [Chloroflexi bacterium]|uniref:Uncharacterized protein n=1 Tax=Candidatus Chlorohelix allophototropha TaxID=3003348 RepID=A0A8T7M6D8_9CHLR|nr:hypothetical protein [Chloroflexota bacterium]
MELALSSSCWTTSTDGKLLGFAGFAGLLLAATGFLLNSCFYFRLSYHQLFPFTHVRIHSRLYAFISQILPFADTSLEKLYEFGKLLQRKLPIQRDVLPLEVQQAIDIESYRVQETTKGKIKLKAQIGELDPIKEKQDYGVKPEDIEPLSLIISELNKRFGTEFGDEDKLLINNLEEIT